ncbi:TRIM65 isoform 6, partial [Pan troglodytes]
PLTPLQWDEDQQLGDLKQLLSRLCGLLLEEGSHPGAPAKPVDLAPVDYRNLTFDPVSANRHFYLSRQDQQVESCSLKKTYSDPNPQDLWL